MQGNETVSAKVRERREVLLGYLSAANAPISGTTLAKRLSVSRQIIVGDIAAIKASGVSVISTRMGYLIPQNPYFERVFKVWHTREQTEDELSTIVDLGGTVSNVYVWHKVYGRIEAALNIRSRLDVASFLEGIRSGKSTELMSVTGGYHYHTVRAESEELLDRIEAALVEKNFIVPEI